MNKQRNDARKRNKKLENRKKIVYKCDSLKLGHQNKANNKKDGEKNHNSVKFFSSAFPRHQD